jgi:hypothetical protein
MNLACQRSAVSYLAPGGLVRGARGEVKWLGMSNGYIAHSLKVVLCAIHNAQQHVLRSEMAFSKISFKHR